MIYTSGTTGAPKGALRTRIDPAITQSLARTLRLRPGEEVHLTTGPLYHSGPLAWVALNHTLGATVVLMRRFDAARWLDLVREHRVTNTFTAPTPLKRVVAQDPEVLARADLSSMRSLVVNAAPVPYALKEEIIARFGDGFLFEVYGSTELGVDAVLEPRGPAEPARLVRAGAAGGRAADRRAGRRRAARRASPARCRSARRSASPDTTAATSPWPTTRAGSRWATSPTSTRTATSTSGTAAVTW